MMKCTKVVLNDPITQFDATRGIDTFTEPFEETEEVIGSVLSELQECLQF